MQHDSVIRDHLQIRDIWVGELAGDPDASDAALNPSSGDSWVQAASGSWGRVSAARAWPDTSDSLHCMSV
jgi:hypothetical protein